MTPDGRTRVQALPKGDPNDNETLRQFAKAVLAVEPTAIGGPISILEAGNTISLAFVQAGLWALVSITILLLLVLRRVTDVLLTLVPLALAGALTLELCVLLGIPMNFANIVALPLLLGIGVAFTIYYVVAWRAGRDKLLQSSLTQAIVFSALTTGTAFGSLWFSSHPGHREHGQAARALPCHGGAGDADLPARADGSPPQAVRCGERARRHLSRSDRRRVLPPRPSTCPWSAAPSRRPLPAAPA